MHKSKNYLVYSLVIVFTLFIITCPHNDSWAYTLAPLIQIAKKYGDGFARKVDDYLKLGKVKVIRSHYDEIISAMGDNLDDFKSLISGLPKEKKAEVIVDIASEKNLVGEMDGLVIKKKIINDEIPEDKLITAIKNKESLKKFVAKEENPDRWGIDKPKHRPDRMLGEQDNAKYAAKNDSERVKIRKKWEEANGRVCEGTVHHIIPVDMIKQKNIYLERLFDACGEFYYPDSPDYIHNPRNGVCVLNGHANHPTYNKAVEKYLTSIPFTLSRGDSCKAIGDVRNCLRKQIEATESGVKINEMPTDIIKTAGTSVTCLIN